MASRTITETISDLSGQEATERVTFAVDGQAYALDLTAAELDEFHMSVDYWAENAQKLHNGKTRNGRSRNGEPKLIRVWARQAGIPVPARGRIPAAIAEQYAAAR